MVRLQVSDNEAGGNVFRCFNSKMVRLQEDRVCKQGFQIVVSIPKWCDCKTSSRADSTSCLLFQFQNGAIARKRGMVFMNAVPNVSIPKWCDCKSALTRAQNFNLSFNSKMVRLQVESLASTIPTEKVSIPKWCDCK